MPGRWGHFIRKLAAASALSAVIATAAAPPAGASLLGGLLGTVTGVVGGVVGIVAPGWDDGATTPPTPMSDVTAALGAGRLWKDGFDGSGVGVALVDSGIAPVEGLLGDGKVVHGPDLSFESQSDDHAHLDTYGHGTHMAGIIAGADTNGGGFRGVAPGAHVVSLKVATREGATDVSQVIAAIDWVVQHRNDPGLNIRVLSLSYGTDGLQDRSIDPLAAAVEAAWRNGIVVVVAGGNDGTDRPALVNPAVNPFVIAVGAADLRGTVSASDDVVAPFSSRGSTSRSVDVVAPGVSVASLRDPGSSIDDAHPGAVVDERYFRGSGTSQAAAAAAGAAALLLDARPQLNPDQVKALFRATATTTSTTAARAQGKGRIDVAKAARSSVPSTWRQGWTPSTGLGSLEGARGTDHLSDDGVELRGEVDVMGRPWDGATWAPRSFAGTAWTGGWWNGTEWAGDCLCSTTLGSAAWSGKRWTGSSWTGKRWTDVAWTGDDWAGKRWTGKRWTGDAWTGKRWTGSSWTGQNWTAAA